jgi:hypothetical protein
VDQQIVGQKRAGIGLEESFAGREVERFNFFHTRKIFLLPFLLPSLPDCLPRVLSPSLVLPFLQSRGRKKRGKLLLFRRKVLPFSRGPRRGDEGFH